MQLQLFHGTNQRFSQFEQSKARVPNDFYGGGVAYFTDNLEVAKTYAKSAAKKGGDRIIYQVTLNVNKVFDVNASFTGKDLIQFFSNRDSEQFARGAGLLSLGTDKYRVLGDLENGTLVLSGEDVFRGLSQGMIKTAAARDKIKSLGYDALRYNGEMNMAATRHDVYIAYYANEIKIHEPRMIVASETQIKEGSVGFEQYVLV
jgi:hypothetical protein